MKKQHKTENSQSAEMTQEQQFDFLKTVRAVHASNARILADSFLTEAGETEVTCDEPKIAIHIKSNPDGSKHLDLTADGEAVQIVAATLALLGYNLEKRKRSDG